jgi:hypothetical protein
VFEVGDLCVRQVEELQFRPRGLFQGDTAGSVGALIQRQHVLALRGEEIGGVDLKERIALHDELAGGIGLEFFDPASEFGSDVRESGFIVVDDADGADGAAQGSASHGRSTDTHNLGGLRIDLNSGRIG